MKQGGLKVDNKKTKDVPKKAAALRYSPEKDKAPRLAAAGRGLTADKIIEIAKENNIPLYEDPALADTLLELDISREIPPELYRVIAEVLVFVYQTDKLFTPGGK